MPNQIPASEKARLKGCLGVVIGLGLFLVLALGPITSSHNHSGSKAMMGAHAIGLAMIAYANDHKGAFPDGGTSTEVFQKLVDEQYVTDPVLFYLKMPGKTAATTNKLSAENVCFDVTSGVVQDSSGEVPLVFTTGYTVTYAPGAVAVRTAGEEAPLGNDELAVFYLNTSAYIVTVPFDGSSTGIVVVSPTFDPGKQIYRQLRP